MTRVVEKKPERTPVNKLAIGCSVVMMIFFVTIHIIVNWFLIPLLEKAFNVF